jgi:thiol-disulfide isomerase/thioredoxin
MVTELTVQDMQVETPQDSDIRVVMFYGTTCGPCKHTLPHYEQASEDFASMGARIKFFKIDAWAPQEQKDYCANVHGIVGVPTFKAFVNGNEFLTKSGGGNLEAMHKLISEIIDEAFKVTGEKY